MGHVWILEYPSSQLGMGCGGVGQNESSGVKQCIGHFYSFILVHLIIFTQGSFSSRA